MSTRWLTIIGIGEDGLTGLSAGARQALDTAEVVIGGDRHHKLSHTVTAERLTWPHPFDALLEELAARRGRNVVILATGDPLWYSVGARIGRAIPPEEITYFPQLSAFQWAAARLGWSLADVETLTAHGRPAEQVIPYFWPGARLLILTAGAQTPGQIARLLTDRGYGASAMTVLGNLGGDRETSMRGEAAEWAARDPVETVPPFNTLAVDCMGTPEPLLSRLPGLPDHAFTHDGKLTKQIVRAATLAKLMPARGEVLWDIGVGCGSVAIEWMRAARDALAYGIDPRPGRLEMARQNAGVLGVPKLALIEGEAPEALGSLPPPNAVFIGGGLSEKTFHTCWDALAPGARLVANAVTLQSEATLLALHSTHGGDLARIAVQTAEPIGAFTGWRPAMPVTQLALIK